MQKLGLIGGTGPESTVIYYRKICQRVYQDTGSLPPLNIESLSVYKVLQFSGNHEFNELVDYLACGVNNLEKSGVNFAALTGITPHVVFDQLQAKVDLPLVSMPAVLCEYAKERQHKRLALLGTAPTMSQHFVQDAFKGSGISIIVPQKDERSYIGEKIEKELEKGIVKEKTQQRLKQIVERMINDDKADGIILGCTELPLAFNGLQLPVETLDAMEIHIQELVKMIESDSKGKLNI
ncbi:MAG TPA: amino acid racemase [Candidatus Limosilactobacillus excrementigallinarum]|nr:amino acid racemase [Candidatus Limosilactobacillus excrementigallinarum]